MSIIVRLNCYLQIIVHRYYMKLKASAYLRVFRSREKTTAKKRKWINSRRQSSILKYFAFSRCLTLSILRNRLLIYTNTSAYHER